MRKEKDLSGAVVYECSYCDILANHKDTILRHERLSHPESRDK